MSKETYEVLQNDNFENLVWTCRVCKINFPKFSKISNSLKQIDNDNKARLGLVEDKLQQFQNEIPIQIQASAKELKLEVKEDITSELKEDITSLIQVQVKEYDERKRRESNIMIFNLPEPKAENPDLRKTEDEDILWNLFDAIDSPQVTMTNIIRIGTRQQGKTRPLKLILCNASDRRKIFDACRLNRLVLSNHSIFNKVVIFITRDYTPVQREENKILRHELKRRQDAGENVKIRGNKIVTANNPTIPTSSKVVPQPVRRTYPGALSRTNIPGQIIINSITSTPKLAHSLPRTTDVDKRRIAYLNNDSLNDFLPTDETTMAYTDADVDNNA
ncbi:hypothetical protein SNE40_014840 [Patella caerulea]